MGVPNKLIKKYPELKGFYQHGFNPIAESGSNQLVGNCIFCGKEGKFYINPEKKKWDCKNASCGRSGGFKSWLKEVIVWSQQFFTGSLALNLSRERGIKLGVLKDAKVGFNPLTNEYLIPTFSHNKEEIWDIKRYNKKNFWSTAGCNKGIFGWEYILDANSIWLCEGEWDTLICRPYMDGINEISVGVPGTDTFMTNWSQLFADKKVFVVFDHDEAGYKGMVKIHKLLVNIASDIKYIHWPESKPEKYDLRDYIKENKSLKEIHTFLYPLPKGYKEEEEKSNNNLVKFKGKGLHYTEVYKKFQEVFYMNDTSVLDVIYGSVIGNRFDGESIWLFLVGPPGSLKSEICMTFTDCPAIVTTTSVTPHSLVSGANFAGGGDPSLIPRLNGKVLIMKDFTTILNMNSMARDDIFGILRDAYDGRTEKVFGNGVTRIYESKFGIVAGVTPAIELFLEGNTAMGERFLSYHIPVVKNLNEQRIMIRRAIENVGTEKDKRKQLREISYKVLDCNFKELPTIPYDYQEKLISLAQFIAMMRGTIVRDKYTKEVTHKPFVEYATRLSKQLTKLLMGILLFKGLDKPTNTEYNIIKCIAHSTVPARMTEACSLLLKQKGMAIELSNYSKSIGLPRSACERTLEDLTMLGILKKEGTTLQSKWLLKKDMLSLMKGAGLV